MPFMQPLVVIDVAGLAAELCLCDPGKDDAGAELPHLAAAAEPEEKARRRAQLKPPFLCYLFDGEPIDVATFTAVMLAKLVKP